MKTFLMRGEQIMHAAAFRTFFSPADFVRQAPLAAGFAYQQLRFFGGGINRYACELLRCTALCPETVEKALPRSPEDFFKVEPVREAMKQYGFNRGDAGIDKCLNAMDLTLFSKAVDDPKVRKLLEEVWALSIETEQDPQMQRRLFCLLGAGYLLAGTTPSERPVSPQALRCALRGEAAAPEKREDWENRPQSGTIPLRCRPEPYRLLLCRGGLPSWETPLSLRKLTAVRGADGDCVTLLLYRTEDDRVPTKVTVEPGDYRFISFLGDCPVTVLPIAVQNGDCRAERQGSRILIRCGEERFTRSLPPNEELISFAVERNVDERFGVLYLWSSTYNVSTADYQEYSDFNMHRSRLYPNEPVIELAMEGEALCMLTQSGRVFSVFSDETKTALTLSERPAADSRGEE